MLRHLALAVAVVAVAVMAAVVAVAAVATVAALGDGPTAETSPARGGVTNRGHLHHKATHLVVVMAGKMFLIQRKIVTPLDRTQETTVAKVEEVLVFLKRIESTPRYATTFKGEQEKSSRRFS